MNKIVTEQNKRAGTGFSQIQRKSKGFLEVWQKDFIFFIFYAKIK